MRRAAVAATVALACLLSGCTTAIGGSGHVGLPRASGPGQGAQVSCPTVRDARVGLSFRCVTSGMAVSDDPLWPLTLSKDVESGWQLAEGAGRIADVGGASLQRLATAVRGDMQMLQSWGPQPGVRTLSSRAATVDGAAAWVLETEFTLDPGYRSENHLSVRTERIWVVAIEAGGDAAVLWYVTLPDDVKSLWASVPKLIDGLRLI